MRQLLLWNWSSLNPTLQKDFQWVYGVTPLSDLSVIYVSWVVYFISIVAIRWYMAERTRIDKSYYGLVCYNGSMVICSTYIWVTSAVSLWQTVREDRHGIRFISYCHAEEYSSFNEYGGSLFYSMYVCYVVRFYVYLDTVILALRKKSIPFLHWYQHMFIILMMWSWLQDQSIFGSLATAIISFVQIFRYLHYFCNCIDRKVALIKKTAIFLQVIQFIAAITLTAYQMSLCPQSNCVLLSASINVTMVYMVVKYYDTNDSTVATTREHYKRRNSHKKVLEDDDLLVEL